MLRNGLASLAAALRACGAGGGLGGALEAAAAPAPLPLRPPASLRWFAGGPAAPAPPPRDFIALNTLADNPGATHYVRGARGGRAAAKG